MSKKKNRPSGGFFVMICVTEDQPSKEAICATDACICETYVPANWLTSTTGLASWVFNVLIYILRLDKGPLYPHIFASGIALIY